MQSPDSRRCTTEVVTCFAAFPRIEATALLPHRRFGFGWEWLVTELTSATAEGPSVGVREDPCPEPLELGEPPEAGLTLLSVRADGGVYRTGIAGGSASAPTEDTNPEAGRSASNPEPTID